ncbi:MAG: DUF4384 domain-containing protein [Acidobacteriota bacterium]
MNINRTASFAAALLLAASAASADPTNINKRIREVPNYPVEVEIWTDRGHNARYCAGESIEIYFRTNVDAYVAIYDIDTTGRIHKLFPTRRAHHNFVRGGEVNRVPARYGYHFEVEGPSGWETLKAIAALDPRDLWDPRETHHGYHRFEDFRTRKPARYGDEPKALPHKIREVPDGPPRGSEVAVAEARHYVRDGYRCRPRAPRPWWYRR